MKVIIDCDPGNDDSWAIISLLRAEERSNYKVLALTTVKGNSSVENCALNALMLLKILGRLSDVPVFKGAEDCLIAKNDNSNGAGTEATNFEPFHGYDGLNDIYKPEEKPSKELVQKKHAVTALKDFIEEVRLSILNIHLYKIFLFRTPTISA